MAEQEVEYVFTRDYLDNNRINLQHYLWVRQFGYHIHPIIQTETTDIRIADIGTGTGIWLLDLVETLPKSATLDGLDISFDALPPKSWLPSNLSLKQWDVREDVPNELIGVYDVIHIRNFVFVLQDQEIPGVLSRLIQMTKPGGYIQWGEPDITSFRIEKADPEVQASASTQLLKISQSQDVRLSPKWVPNLPQLFHAHGLEKIESDKKDAPEYLKMAMHENNLVIHELVARKSQNREMGEKIQTLMPRVLYETQQGVCWAFDRWSVIGKKPIAT